MLSELCSGNSQIKADIRVQGWPGDKYQIGGPPKEAAWSNLTLGHLEEHYVLLAISPAQENYFCYSNCRWLTFLNVIQLVF